AGIENFRDLIAVNPETGTMVIAVSAIQGPELEEVMDPTQTKLVRYRHAATEDDEKQIRAENGLLPVCKEPSIYSGEFSSNLSQSVITKTSLREMPKSTVYRADWKSAGTLSSVAIEPPFQPNVKVEKVGDYWTAV